MSTVSPLDLNYKEDSPRADTKIQSSLLPKESNPDTFREEKTCCKKIWMDPEHCKSSSCTCSSPLYVLQQKQCHLSRSHHGGDNHSSHLKKLLIRLPPALYQDNQDGCDVKSKGGGLRDNKCLCCSQTLF